MNQTYTILAVVFLGLILELIYAFKLKSDKKRIDTINAQYEKELEETKKQLDKIITSTRKEAQEVVSKTLEQYNEVHSEVAELIVKINEEVTTNLTHQLTTYQELLAHKTIEATDSLTTASQEEIRKLSRNLQETIQNTQQKITQELIESSQTAKKDIETYKKQQIEKVAQQSSVLITEITKKYLTNNISNANQHEIVLQLIDEVLQEGDTSKNE